MYLGFLRNIDERMLVDAGGLGFGLRAYSSESE